MLLLLLLGQGGVEERATRLSGECHASWGQAKTRRLPTRRPLRWLQPMAREQLPRELGEEPGTLGRAKGQHGRVLLLLLLLLLLLIPILCHEVGVLLLLLPDLIQLFLDLALLLCNQLELLSISFRELTASLFGSALLGAQSLQGLAVHTNLLL